MVLPSENAPERAAEVASKVGAFLDFIGCDINEHPERLRPVTRELYDRVRRATEGVEVDPYAEIERSVAL